MANHFDVLGTRVDATSVPAVISELQDAIGRRAKASVVFCTVSSVLSARKDPAVRAAFDSASIVCPDGMPLVWLGRRAGEEVERVYGPDFMIDLMTATGGKYSHYFYGGAPGVAEEMARRLTERFPGLRIAGCSSPPFGIDPVDDSSADVETIERSGADILWVGLGHPKQELWMAHNRAQLSAPVIAAVGAAFDFHAGLKKEAPRWMKRSGLQWLHRLLSEPKRLWRRYLLGNSEFVLLLIRDRIFRNKG